MGVPKGGTYDVANDISQTTFTATDAGGAGTTATTGRLAAIGVYGLFNIFLIGTGWTGTVVLERSFDGGNTWVTHVEDSWSVPATFSGNISAVVTEPEQGMLWRLRCSAFTAGTMVARISQSVDFQLIGGTSR